MTSRLAQMQARFQEKQMQEKEEKLSKLYENQQQRAFERVGRGSAGSNTTTASIGSTGGGKVRQMFDERRQKAGVDKSYPLVPLKGKTTATRAPVKTNTSRTTVVKSTVNKTVSQARNGKPIVNQKETYQKVYNNNNFKNGTYEEHSRVVESYDDIDGHNNLIEMVRNHNFYGDLDDEELPKIGFNENYLDKPPYMTGKLANVGGKLPSQKVGSKPISNNLNQKNGATGLESKVAAKKPIAKTTTPPRSSSSVSSASSQSSRNSPARSENTMSSRRAPSTQSGRAPTNTRPSAKQSSKSPVVRDDLAECRYCGRRFATDRLGTHEDICGKTGKKKRKSYDAAKHRVQGTELEGYALKGGKKSGGSKISKVLDETSKNNKNIKISSKPSVSKSNWRKTHEEFISAIRSAKQAQAYVAKGGKLSDLPPPPPSTNPDYVQCPHCGRRFNEAAAQRHIPKCASYDYNKPKNGSSQRGRRN